MTETRSIWKFPIGDALKGGSFEVTMPVGAQLLHVGIDPTGQPCVWALVNPENDVEVRRFTEAGTGWGIAVDRFVYVGTYMQGDFVWHLLEERCAS